MLQDYYTITQAAPLIGRTPMTIYRWVKAGKIRHSEFGGIHFISYATIQEARIKACRNCYHTNNGFCACREIADMSDPCSDWYPIELKG